MKMLLAMLLALVLALSMLTMAVFAEPGTEEEEVDEVPVVDEVPEENPTTGLALAVVPMLVAGAAVAISKKH